MRKLILLLVACLLVLINSIKSNAEQTVGGLLNDSETAEVIIKLIDPLVKAAGVPNKKVNLYIIIDKEINAFVTRGGNLFINTGLITAFNDPDVLKGVVAHELAHMSSGHTILRGVQIDDILRQSLITTLLGISAAAAGSPELGTAVILGGQHTSERRYMAYSREQETVADRLGVKYLHKTGNTISGFTKLLESFGNSEMYLDSRGINGYMLTHPLSKERLKLVRDYALQEKNNPSIHSSSEEEKESYARIVAKLRSFLETDSYLSNAKKDLSGFPKAYGDAIALYRKSQFTKSFSLIDNLLKSNPDDGYLYELKGQFLFETGQMPQAIETYKKAVSLLGNKSSLKIDYAIVLITTREIHKDRARREEILGEAISILNKAMDDPYQKSPYIYRNLAIAYGELGKIGYSNLMLAEEAILLRKIPDAKKFIAMARNYSSKDVKLKLKIEDISNSLEKYN
jgi:predicted Zn-dependent protease